MSLPRYPKYKDSGVEWLGEVPVHWTLRRLKRACEVFPSNVDKKVYDGETAVLLCNYTHVYYNDVISAGLDFMAASASDDQIAKFTLRAGDTIITKDSETADDIAVAAYVPDDLPGVVCGYHLSMLRPQPGTCGAFVKRLFDSTFTKACVQVRANGLTRVGLGQHDVDNLELPFPPLAEQAHIAAFLDRETAKIDALVAEQQRLMELLKEKRQAVISHAVTKGLNPDAPMKDSGIEWLGEVPAHWAIDRFKWSTHSCKNGIWGEEAQGNEDDIPCVRVADFDRRRLRVELDSPTVRNVTAKERQGRVLARGDLLLEKSGGGDLQPVGCVVLYDDPQPAVCSNFVARMELAADMVPSFWRYLHTAAYSVRLNTKSIKQTSGIQNLDQQAYLDEAAVFPPSDEQAHIAAFLDRETAKIDTLTAEAQRAIDLLQERRTALISAAVTGQIDVRPAAERASA